MVQPAQVFDLAVGAPARQVAGAIHALARRERIGHEALGGERRAVQVAAREARAGQVQLAGHARRLRLQRVVEHVEPEVVDRRADRHRGRFGVEPARPEAHVDRGLGGAVEVVQARAEARQEAVLGIGAQRLAAAHHVAQAGAAVRRRVFEEGVQHRGHEVHHADALGVDGARQVGGVAMAAGFGHHQPRAFQQRPEQLPDGHVEAERGLLQHAVLRVEPVGLLHPGQPVDDAAMLDQHALGTAGGARGVDHVGGMMRRGQLGRRLAGMRGERGGIAFALFAVLVGVAGLVERHPRRLRRRQALQQMRLAQHDRHARVVEQVGEPLGGMFRVERQVGCAGLERAEQGHHHRQRALGEYADHAVGAGAERAQPMREAVGATVEFGIAERGRAGGDGDRLGRARHLLREARMQGVVRKRRVGIVPFAQEACAGGLVEQAEPVHRLGGARHGILDQAEQALLVLAQFVLAVERGMAVEIDAHALVVHRGHRGRDRQVGRRAGRQRMRGEARRAGERGPSKKVMLTCGPYRRWPSAGRPSSRLSSVLR